MRLNKSVYDALTTFHPHSNLTKPPAALYLRRIRWRYLYLPLYISSTTNAYIYIYLALLMQLLTLPFPCTSWRHWSTCYMLHLHISVQKRGTGSAAVPIHYSDCCGKLLTSVHYQLITDSCIMSLSISCEMLLNIIIYLSWIAAWNILNVKWNFSRVRELFNDFIIFFDNW